MMIQDIFLIASLNMGQVIILCLIIIYAEWSVHAELTRETCKEYGWGNFNKFINEFNKYKWKTRNPNFKNSLFEDKEFKPYNSEIHAGLIIFNGIGMTLWPISYFRAMIFVRRKCREINNNHSKDKNYKW